MRRWSGSSASEACPGFLCCQARVAQLPAGVLQPWKGARAVGLPALAGFLLKDGGECHFSVNSPSSDLSGARPGRFTACSPRYVFTSTHKTHPLAPNQFRSVPVRVPVRAAERGLQGGVPARAGRLISKVHLFSGHAACFPWRMKLWVVQVIDGKCLGL